MTILENELFVVNKENLEVEIFDSIKLSFSRRWNSKELIYPQDIVSCSISKRIYVLNSCRDQIMESFKVDPNRNLLKKWSTGCNSGCSLSVTVESNVIFAARNTNKLIEYSPDGQLIREIDLSLNADISLLWHAVKLTNGHFVVSHGNGYSDVEGVCRGDSGYRWKTD